MRTYGVRWALWALIGMMIMGCGCWLFCPRVKSKRMIATILLNNQVVRQLILDETEDQVFSIQEETGREITFEIKEKAIRFLSSNCPDQICVRTGFLRGDSDLPLAACLPNGVILTISPEEE